MRAALIAYAGALFAFVVVDFAWLSVMAGRLYRPALGEILRAKPDLGPAILFYLIYAGAIVALAVMPAANAGRAALSGAILGLAAYATYNLSNLATLKIYSVPVTIVDTTWGAVVTAIAAWAAFKLSAAFAG